MDLMMGGGSSKIDKNLIFIFAIVIVLIIMLDLWFVQKILLYNKCKKEHLHAVQSHGYGGLKYQTNADFVRSESDFENREGEFYKKYYM